MILFSIGSFKSQTKSLYLRFFDNRSSGCGTVVVVVVVLPHDT